MTLSGLVLAIGILVDDATVTIENMNWHLEHGKGVIAAIMDGAAQIVKPALVALLSICIVFVPMFFLPGIAGFLFVPLALAVIFALLTSFVLARTHPSLVGGAPLNEAFAESIGADAYCRDAAVAVETAKELLARKHNELRAARAA